jgi:23S rRNA 5-hydroxycytidine C2501 synthase
MACRRQFTFIGTAIHPLIEPRHVHGWEAPHLSIIMVGSAGYWLGGIVKSLELLAPAGNAEIGIAAIDHGADAVYVGAPRFSARANAGVNTSDMGRLIQHAHLYYAKVYVALNTILSDQELREALEVIREVYDLGADGLIIQDPGLLELDLPPIPLIASTQMHNDTPEKVQFLEAVGFKRVILARELSLDQIAAIRQTTNIELECFVHGALCVSYSGQCYISQAATGRSGNRGVCAQPCRSHYTLTDGDGKIILSGKFLLSLKDLNLMQDIPALIAAGISSFKIEGRYKEIDYVKNVTAAYSRTLDTFICDHPNYRRVSSGKSELTFDPNPEKTFNRGFTRYFISGRSEKIASMDTPKSMGQPIGTVTHIGKGFFKSDCNDLQNGDGLCFFTKGAQLAGFRVERVEGSRIVPNSMKDLAKGIRLYRNHDIAFTRRLKKNSGQKKIFVELQLSHEGDKVRLTATDEDNNQAELMHEAFFEEPKDPACMRELIEKHLSSTGNTPYRVTGINISRRFGFFQVSFLNRIKQDVLADLTKIRASRYRRETAGIVRNSVPYPEKRLDFHANVYNEYARRFYRRHGAEVVEPAFESQPDQAGREVMRMKYCLRYELDACPKFGQLQRKLKEPLQFGDGHHVYRLNFDCEVCRMSVTFLGEKK